MFVAQYHDGCLAGVDPSSGGYPWKAYIPGTTDTLNCIRFWGTQGEAEEYCKTFPELTVKEFTFQVIAVKDAVVFTATEESALLKLFESYEMNAGWLPEPLRKLRLLLEFRKTTNS